MALLKYNKHEYLSKSIKAKMTLEVRLRKELTRLFREYSFTVYSSYKAYGLPHFPSSFRSSLKDILEKHYTRVGSYFSKFNRQYKKKEKKAQSQVDKTITKKLNKFYDKLLSQRVDGITDTTEERLRRYAKKLEGKRNEDGTQISRTDIARALKDHIITTSISRANMIATTETNTVANGASEIEVESMIEEADDDELEELLGEDADPDILAQVISLGGMAALAAGLLSVTKTWSTIIDSVTRPEHAEADGQEVALGEPFEVGGEELEYPGDESGSEENTINCRCSVIYSI